MNAVPASSKSAPQVSLALPHATRQLAGIWVPDSPPITRAIEYAREQSERYLFNHVMRSWLFAEALAQQNHQVHDGEVLAVATLLHDLGLSESFSGTQRFEVESANSARNFARREGFDTRRTQLIWDSVALNSTPSIALHKETEVSLCTLGIALDWGGFGYESLSGSLIDAVVTLFPRLQMKQQFTRAVCRICEARPATTHDNFARDFGERFVPGYTGTSSVDLLFGAPFQE
jgi:hypothetical protein